MRQHESCENTASVCISGLTDRPQDFLQEVVEFAGFRVADTGIVAIMAFG